MITFSPMVANSTPLPATLRAYAAITLPLYCYATAAASACLLLMAYVISMMLAMLRVMPHMLP